MREVGGSNPSSPTGNEGDGNPPALGAGNTQFDSEVPDHGSLAQTGERSPEKRQGDDSIASGATVRMSFNGRTGALQAPNGSSILPRSTTGEYV